MCDDKCKAKESFGGTECEEDKAGRFTGKVKKEVTDKNPCTRPCVELHEGVHEKRLAPICTTAKRCLDAAGDDQDKTFKCYDKYADDIIGHLFATECAAYTAEEECLSKRAGKAECKSADGKKRRDEQMKMVKCYEGCFCQQ